jgi:UDP-N-acetylmuramoyl-tripeptide--D-alanyl-D-alanine ligase
MAAYARCQVITYGVEDSAYGMGHRPMGGRPDVRADHVRDYGLDGFAFRITARGRSRDVRTPLIGRHNVHNCLAAAAVALEEGMTITEIADALATATNPLRLKVLPGPNGSTLIDDTYNANPTSMKAALDLLKTIGHGRRGRLIAVLGDMFELGDEERRLHRELGKRAAYSADLLFLSGTRSRWTASAARAYARGLARDVGVEKPIVQHLPNPDDLPAALLEVASPGDVILLKASRGMAFERVVAALLAARDDEARPGARAGVDVVASHPSP